VKPYVGQIVQYKYVSTSIPVAAIISIVHDAEWVALWTFEPLQRFVPHVEYKVHCFEAKYVNPLYPWHQDDGDSS